MKKSYFNLTVYCDGATPGFLVDESTLNQFEEDFANNKPVSSFVNHPKQSKVVLRNHKLAGYEKSALTEENSEILNDVG